MQIIYILQVCTNIIRLKHRYLYINIIIFLKDFTDSKTTTKTLKLFMVFLKKNVLI